MSDSSTLKIKLYSSYQVLIVSSYQETNKSILVWISWSSRAVAPVITRNLKWLIIKAKPIFILSDVKFFNLKNQAVLSLSTTHDFMLLLRNKQVDSCLNQLGFESRSTSDNQKPPVVNYASKANVHTPWFQILQLWKQSMTYFTNY